jgi:hypothetical protein
MRKVFLLTGFQNWGKTWLIKKLFNRQRFFEHSVYNYHGHSFCVIPKSNDDLGQLGYESEYHRRIKKLYGKNIVPQYIFSAFCPTKEPTNLSDQIISNLYRADQVILIPIEYKWCAHARLQLNEISTYYATLGNVSIQPLTLLNPAGKLQDLKKIVVQNLP